MSGLPDVAATLRSLAVHHLPGAPAISGAAAYSASDEAGAELVRLAAHHRLLGSLSDAVDSGRLVLTEHAVEELRHFHEAAMRWCIHLESRLLEVRELFAKGGELRMVVLKGPAIAHLDELDPTSRSFADLDLLIESDDIDLAVEALTARGATRQWGERRPGYDRRFAKSVTMTCSDDVEVDIHRTLTDGVHGVRVPRAELFACSETFEIGGRELSALGLDHRVLHAMYHAVLGSPTPALHSLRDVAGYLRRPDVSPEVVLATAARWGGVEVVSEAVRAVEEITSMDAPAWRGLLDGYELDPGELKKIERQRVDGSSFGRARFDQWREPGLAGQRLAFATAVLWPSAVPRRSRFGMASRRWRLSHVRRRTQG